MISLLNGIADLLQFNGIGTVNTDIFKGFKPDQPDNLIALFEYAGSPMGLTMGKSDPVIERPGLQVWVRNYLYPDGRAKIDQVVDVLHGQANITLDGDRYLLIQANQSPESIGMDANNRSEFVVNFSIIKER